MKLLFCRGENQRLYLVFSGFATFLIIFPFGADDICNSDWNCLSLGFKYLNAAWIKKMWYVVTFEELSGEDTSIHEFFSMVNAAFCFISWEHKVDLEHPYKFQQ